MRFIQARAVATESYDAKNELIARLANQYSYDPWRVRIFDMQRASLRLWMGLFFVADRWQGEPVICEPDKCDDLRWVRPDALPERIVPYVPRVLAHWRAGVMFSTYGWD